MKISVEAYFCFVILPEILFKPLLKKLNKMQPGGERRAWQVLKDFFDASKGNIVFVP